MPYPPHPKPYVVWDYADNDPTKPFEFRVVNPDGTPRPEVYRSYAAAMRTLDPDWR